MLALEARAWRQSKLAYKQANAVKRRNIPEATACGVKKRELSFPLVGKVGLYWKWFQGRDEAQVKLETLAGACQRKDGKGILGKDGVQAKVQLVSLK